MMIRHFFLDNPGSLLPVFPLHEPAFTGNSTHYFFVENNSSKTQVSANQQVQEEEFRRMVATCRSVGGRKGMSDGTRTNGFG